MPTKNKKIVWCAEEDRIVSELISQNGLKDWGKIANDLYRIHGTKRKTGRQCRERWYNHLDPSIVKRVWTREEEDILFEEHRKNGSKWALIADKLAGRSDNDIKNHFYSTIRKSLRRVNKFLGSKDGTAKIKKIKPSTLSSVFSLQATKSEVTLHKEVEKSYGFCSASLDKDCVYHLINFSRRKLSDQRVELSEQESQRFQNLLKQMVKINNAYEKQREQQQKINREKRLCKRFDDQIQSDLESEQSEKPLKKRKTKIPKTKPQKGDKLTPPQQSNEVKQYDVMSFFPDLAPQESFKSTQMSSKNKQNDGNQQFFFVLEQDSFPIDMANTMPLINISPSFFTPKQRKIWNQTDDIGPMKNYQCNDIAQKVMQQIRLRNEKRQFQDRWMEHESPCLIRQNS